MDLYAELILDHSRHPEYAGLREPFDAEVHHVNPACGDEVHLRVHVTDGRVLDISHQSIGCSISIAATSVLAHESVGQPVADTLRFGAALRAMLTSKGSDPGDPEQLGDAIAFAGVSKYPARVKCALLGWSAYTDALVRAGVDIEQPDQSA